MFKLTVLGPILILHGVTAIIHLAVRDYDNAPQDTKALIDKISNNYCTFAILELVKNIPTLENPKKCSDSKAEFIENLGKLLKETSVTATTGDSILIQSKEGQLKVPYLVRNGNEPVTCQKNIDVDVMQIAIKKQIAEQYDQMVGSLMNTEKLEQLSRDILQHDQVIKLTKMVQTQLNTARESLEKQPQMKQMLKTIDEHAKMFNNIVYNVAQNEKVQQLTNTVNAHAQAVAATVAASPQYQRLKSIGAEQYEKARVVVDEYKRNLVRWGSNRFGLPFATTGTTPAKTTSP